jgi:hypothetical protein
MKAFNYLLILVLTSTISTSAFSQTAKVKQVADYPVLVDFFTIVSEVASEGASLAFFGFSENRRTIPNESCRVAKAAEVSDYFNVILETISYDPKDLIDDRLTKNFIKQAKTNWLQLMNKGPFEICEGTVSGHMTLGHLTVFKSKNYFIEFEFGYED